MKILILLLLTHELQIVHSNILTVKTLQQINAQPRVLNDQAYTKQALRACKNMPGSALTDIENCTTILKHEYFASGKHTRPQVYQAIREHEALYVILCEQQKICPEIEHFLSYQECRRLQRNQTVSEVKERIWLRVYKVCENKIYPHQYQYCENNLKGPLLFNEGMNFYNEYCRYLYHKFQKVSTNTCGREYFLNQHFIKYEYSNCLHLLGSSNLLNEASCLANDFMYKYYKVPCRKFFNVADDEFKNQCKTSLGFANLFRKRCLIRFKKAPLTDFLTFKNSKCGEGEKSLMVHCHRKSKFIIDIMSWVAILVITIVGTGVLFKLIRGIFSTKNHTRRKLVQTNYPPRSAIGLLGNLARNFDNLKIFDRKSKRKLTNFLQLDSKIQQKKRTHFARVLKENDLNKSFNDYNINDTRKFLRLAATDFIGLDKRVLKTLTPKVLKKVHQICKKIHL